MAGGPGIFVHLDVTVEGETLPTLAANTGDYYDVTVPGTKVGDVCVAVPTTAVNDGYNFGHCLPVTTAGTVSVHVANVTTSSINPTGTHDVRFVVVNRNH